MSPREEVAWLRFEKAQAALRDGVTLQEQGSWDAAISRFYYASFHAARSLLAMREKDSRSHAGLIAVFNETFAKTGLLDRDTARLLARGFERRQRSDYSDLDAASREDAESARADAARFVAACEDLLRRESGRETART